MIITKLQGGLGNQMFQYAAARACSPDEIIAVDLSFLKNNTTSTDAFTSRKYRLDVFKNISVKVLKPFRRKIIMDRGLGYRLLKKLLWPGSKTINDHGTSPATHLNLKRKGAVYLDGYFQSEKYFNHIRPLLLREFSFSELQGKPALMMNNIKARKTSVAIHVRHGDYLKPEIAAYHGVLPLSYYTKAIAYVDSVTAHAHYFIFSDDMPWCRENFAFLKDRITFTDVGEQDWVDLALMSSCNHQVVANSSFSWWAAWLNPAHEKIVIAPEKWFADSSAINQAGNIVPNNWIKI
ncbi:MAG: alpha-1,2-fucosyltransferase [Mucilaginibacter sp.]|uniref:alpha-1,2-fucosyltransferase n=1 Tax=Mucilaginibacter sp. TaxID=1882438 RepID=UPI0031A96B73